MILSDQLLGLQGQVLLPQGTVLTESMLASLPRYGIEMLPILLTLALSEEEVAAARQRRLERLTHLFRKHNLDADSEPGQEQNQDGPDATSLLRSVVTAYRSGAQEPA
ncbi:hypothetical protein [Janthinobacterium agaricidamnosum]|nr:hypothetical protein [Janthinobacterium agaricidamnosum]